MYIYVCIYIYIYKYVHMYTCIYICICTFIYMNQCAVHLKWRQHYKSTIKNKANRFFKKVVNLFWSYVSLCYWGDFRVGLLDSLKIWLVTRRTKWLEGWNFSASHWRGRRRGWWLVIKPINTVRSDEVQNWETHPCAGRVAHPTPWGQKQLCPGLF